MPRWKPDKKWQDQDVFIIGGGTSLEGFDWNLLKDKRTIGCNDAYMLGEEVCKLCVFGDSRWFDAHKDKVGLYKGVLFTNAKRYRNTNIKMPSGKWLWTTPRISQGLGVDRLAWNRNTGAVAVNLALILGAKRVILLGFDMHLSKDGRPNWHKNKLLSQPDAKVYKRFIQGFVKLNEAMAETFPNAEIINVTDDSGLNVFCKIGCEEFWKNGKGDRK